MVVKLYYSKNNPQRSSSSFSRKAAFIKYIVNKEKREHTGELLKLYEH